MNWSAAEVLRVLDDCAAKFTFPVLDNGYVYPAASRLTAFRSAPDWALAIEVFGYSPRCGVPETYIYTFASRFAARVDIPKLCSSEQWHRFLLAHAHDQMHIVNPVELGAAQDADCDEYLALDAHSVIVRGNEVIVPTASAYQECGVVLLEPPRVHVFELCRLLAEDNRSSLLATPVELRRYLPDELEVSLQLDEWHHPDISGGAKPSESPTFVGIAAAISTGEQNGFRAFSEPNSHWKYWPDAGTM